jgi:hypothetical protein
VQAAAALLRACFGGDPGGPAPRDLTKALEAALEAPRRQWPTGLCRRLWEFLAEAADGRTRSPAHFARWANLVGYCLRPGFGDSMDKFRIEQLWKLTTAPPRPGTARAPEGGADYWILWRRTAGGLSASLQRALSDRLRPALLPGKSKSAAKPSPNETAEMWRAAASLERLDAKQKEVLGDALVKSLRRTPTPTYGFWSLTRLGARALLYGPLNAVVHPQVAERWLDAVVGFSPGDASERLGWLFCLTQLARRTGQRALDVDDSRRRGVLTVLGDQLASPHWIKMVEEVSELEQEEQGQLLGDSLPIGLRLVKPEDGESST